MTVYFQRAPLLSGIQAVNWPRRAHRTMPGGNYARATHEPKHRRTATAGRASKWLQTLCRTICTYLKLHLHFTFDFKKEPSKALSSVRYSWTYSITIHKRNHSHLTCRLHLHLHTTNTMNKSSNCIAGLLRRVPPLILWNIMFDLWTV